MSGTCRLVEADCGWTDFASHTLQDRLMKPFLKISTTAAVLLTTFSVATSQPPPPPGGEGGRPPGGPGGRGPGGRGPGGPGGSRQVATLDSFLSRMMKLDKDADGSLQKAEVSDERLSDLFGRADADKDGTVTKKELTALYEKESATLRESGRGGPGGPGGPGAGPPPGGPPRGPRRGDGAENGDRRPPPRSSSEENR
jgi:hypothetical protein